MSQTNKVKTKLSVLSLEGPHGLQLRIKSRHRLLEAISGKTNSPVLVADGHIELHLEVSVDREKCSAKAMRKSGLLRSLLAFFRDNGSKLRIESVGDVLVESEHRILIPLILETFPSPLKRYLRYPTRLQSICLRLNFDSGADASQTSDQVPEKSLPALLMLKKLSPTLSSFVFRGLQKFAAALAQKYPLIFHAAFLEQLRDESVWMPRMAKSLSNVVRNVASDKLKTYSRHATNALRSKYEFDSDELASHNSAEADNDDIEDAHDYRRLRNDTKTNPTTTAFESAFFDLLLNASKRRGLFADEEPIISAPADTSTTPNLHGTPVNEQASFNRHRARSRTSSIASVSPRYTESKDVSTIESSITPRIPLNDVIVEENTYTKLDDWIWSGSASNSDGDNDAHLNFMLLSDASREEEEADESRKCETYALNESALDDDLFDYDIDEVYCLDGDGPTPVLGETYRATHSETIHQDVEERMRHLNAAYTLASEPSRGTYDFDEVERVEARMQRMLEGDTGSDSDAG